MSFPNRQFLAVYSKGNMNGALAVMRRDASSGKVRLLEGRIADEQQQYMFACDIERAEALVLDQRPQTQDALVELFRSL